MTPEQAECPICHTESAAVGFSTPSGRPISRCGACGLHLGGPDGTEPTSIPAQLAAEGAQWRVTMLGQLLGRRGGRLLDLSADERFASAAGLAGWTVTSVGLDEAPSASAGEKYDVITLWDVLGRLEDPRLLGVLRDLLREDGSVFVLSPDCRGSESKAQGKKWPLYEEGYRVYPDAHAHETVLRAAGLGEARHVYLDRPGHDYVLTYTRPVTTSPTIRTLFVDRPDAFDIMGGDTVQMCETMRHLESVDVSVDLALSLRPQSSDYDVAHLFNIQLPWTELPQMKSLKKRSRTPVVLAPLYGEYSQRNWAYLTVPGIFGELQGTAELRRRLQALGDGSLQITYSGTVLGDRSKIILQGPDFEPQQREIVEMADHIIATSYNEMRELGRGLGIYNKPFTVVRNAAQHEVFLNATPDLFVKKHGLSDFVICAGRFEVGKNQVMLIHALRDTGLKLVLVGAAGEPDYYELCRSTAGKNVTFIDHMPQEELASAYAAARVAALPSWFEIASLAAIEAAAAGCAIVVGDRSSEWEYFGEHAWYCSPASVESIKSAVLAAWHAESKNAEDLQALRRRFTEEWTWDEAAKRCRGAYEKVLSERKPGA